MRVVGYLAFVVDMTFLPNMGIGRREKSAHAKDAERYDEYTQTDTWHRDFIIRDMI